MSQVGMKSNIKKTQPIVNPPRVSTVNQISQWAAMTDEEFSQALPQITNKWTQFTALLARTKFTANCPHQRGRGIPVQFLSIDFNNLDVRVVGFQEVDKFVYPVFSAYFVTTGFLSSTFKNVMGIATVYNTKTGKNDYDYKEEEIQDYARLDYSFWLPEYKPQVDMLRREWKMSLPFSWKNIIADKQLLQAQNQPKVPSLLKLPDDVINQNKEKDTTEKQSKEQSKENKKQPTKAPKMDNTPLIEEANVPIVPSKPKIILKPMGKSASQTAVPIKKSGAPVTTLKNISSSVKKPYPKPNVEVIQTDAGDGTTKEKPKVRAQEQEQEKDQAKEDPENEFLKEMDEGSEPIKQQPLQTAPLQKERVDKRKRDQEKESEKEEKQKAKEPKKDLESPMEAFIKRFESLAPEKQQFLEWLYKREWIVDNCPTRLVTMYSIAQARPEWDPDTVSAKIGAIDSIVLNNMDTMDKKEPLDNFQLTYPPWVPVINNNTNTLTNNNNNNNTTEVPLTTHHSVSPPPSNTPIPDSEQLEKLKQAMDLLTRPKSTSPPPVSKPSTEARELPFLLQSSGFQPSTKPDSTTTASPSTTAVTHIIQPSPIPSPVIEKPVEEPKEKPILVPEVSEPVKKVIVEEEKIVEAIVVSPVVVEVTKPAPKEESEPAKEDQPQRKEESSIDELSAMLDDDSESETELQETQPPKKEDQPKREENVKEHKVVAELTKANLEKHNGDEHVSIELDLPETTLALYLGQEDDVAESPKLKAQDKRESASKRSSSRRSNTKEYTERDTRSSTKDPKDGKLMSVVGSVGRRDRREHARTTQRFPYK